MKWLRVFLEICFCLLYLGLNGFLLALSPLYLGTLMILSVLGYLVSLIVLLKHHPLRDQGSLDLWLATFVISVPITLLLIDYRWPLRFQGFDAHGFGMTGGELNLIFLPWLHVSLYLAGRKILKKTGVFTKNKEVLSNRKSV
jgi:hypothetical protein